MSNTINQAHPLAVGSLPLTGTHLIEASAGTGKTFNITRLYLRLLLESELSVTQILVMTFTNAATEELRGRLTDTLRQASLYWQSDEYRANNPDPIFAELYVRIECELAISRLELALVEMDEAAIYTLHGFCQRILKQMAFNTGNALQLTLQNDQQKNVLMSAEDWFRKLSFEPEKLLLLAQSNWHTPAAFIEHFLPMIEHQQLPQVVDAETIENDHTQQLLAIKASYHPELKEQLDSLLKHQNEIIDQLIEQQKKADVQQQRRIEWDVLLNWLETADIENIPSEVGAFLNGNRYKGKNRASIKTLLTPLSELRKALDKAVKKLQEQTEKRRQTMPLFEVVVEGLEYIKLRIASEKSLRGEVSFDDLIQRLASAVESDPQIAEQLSVAFPAALIDEFQDTDAQQYSLLSNVYFDRAKLLVMIGDPKQAIYGFRGGDIFTYLRAKDSADYIWFMDTNWRSTDAMVQAYNRVFWGNALDQQAEPVFGFGINYEKVNSTPHSAAAKRPMQETSPTHGNAALTYITSDLSAVSEAEPSRAKDLQQQQLSLWCVTEIKRLLTSVKLAGEPVQPADIAILVRSGVEAQRISEYLRAHSLTAVYLSDKTPLFSSLQAHEVMLVLSGIWHCDNDSDLIRALSSPLFGVEPSLLAKMQRDPLTKEWSELRARVYGYRQYWLRYGVMPLLIKLIKTHYQPAFDGERALTNFMHLTEILEQASRQQSHPLQVLQWLKSKISHIDQEEQYEQRLESDAGLIKIVTQHKSKGLEYPFVFVPYANEYRDPTKHKRATKQVLRFYDPSTKVQTWQLGQSQYALELLREQEHAESIRLLYVAITRAEYRCYLGIGEYENSELSAIGLALGKGASQDSSYSWQEFLKAVCAEGNNFSNICIASQLPQLTGELNSSSVDLALNARQTNRQYAEQWRVHSFSGLTKFNQQAVISERESEADVVTPVLPALSSLSNSAAVEVDDARFVFPKGATPGNFIHDVFEHTDFSEPSWETQCKQNNARYGLISDDQLPDICRWFDSVINTWLQLGEGGKTRVSLGQLSHQHTLREAEFYFPINAIQSEDLVTLLNQHRQHLHQQGLLSAELLLQPMKLGSSEIEGMMHGFIDLIFEYEGKFYVADYKSTHLGDSLEHYSPAALAVNNLSHAYDLQYLIYALALHRYLQHSLPDYEPRRHFGGVCYLYVRGMHHASDSNHGVFYTPINDALLSALDALFAKPVAAKKTSNELGEQQDFWQ